MVSMQSRGGRASSTWSCCFGKDAAKAEENSSRGHPSLTAPLSGPPSDDPDGTWIAVAGCFRWFVDMTKVWSDTGPGQPSAELGLSRQTPASCHLSSGTASQSRRAGLPQHLEAPDVRSESDWTDRARQLPHRAGPDAAKGPSDATKRAIFEITIAQLAPRTYHTLPTGLSYWRHANP
ncbi:hypothetical protein VTK26DRAFT_1183 [Humicola hyalothermophila]